MTTLVRDSAGNIIHCGDPTCTLCEPLENQPVPSAQTEIDRLQIERDDEIRGLNDALAFQRELAIKQEAEIERLQSLLDQANELLAEGVGHVVTLSAKVEQQRQLLNLADSLIGILSK